MLSSYLLKLLQINGLIMISILIHFMKLLYCSHSEVVTRINSYPDYFCAIVYNYEYKLSASCIPRKHKNEHNRQ